MSRRMSKEPLATYRAAMETLADFIVDAKVDERALAFATSAVLDTMAVTLGGSVELVVQRLQEALDPMSGSRSVRLPWSTSSYSRSDAALITGASSHVLDYDDVSMLSVCHPSAPVLSALLNVQNWDGVSGQTVLEAFVVGTEVLVRLGQTMGFRHYALGFHATATLGAVGAAAACARVMRLDRTRTRHALAIAASMSSGLQVNFGSMVKSLHVGLAASNGLKAALLASKGIEGAQEVFSGGGFIRAFSGGESSEWPSDIRLGAPFVIVDPGFEQKRYPCCYMLHRMAEATLFLRRRHDVRLQDVKQVLVDMPFGGTKPLIHPYPQTGLNALFSGPYAVVASLVDGRLDLTSFIDSEVLRSDVQRRLGDVTLQERALGEPAETLAEAPVTVMLTLRDGSTVKHTVTASPGSAEDPLTPDQLRRKWIDCLRRACPSVDDAVAGAVFDQGRRLSEMPYAGEWIAAIASTSATSHKRTN